MTATHHRHAHFRHYRAYIRKIHVNHTRADNQIRDTLYSSQQYIIGCRKSLQQACCFTHYILKFFVRNGNQRINVLRQRFNTFLGDFHALTAFKCEWLGNHRNRQNTHLTSYLCKNRRCTRTGSATHTCCNENHIGTFQHFGNACMIFDRRLAANFRISTRTQSFGGVSTQLQNRFCRDIFQCLRIGIGANKFYALNITRQHVVKRVTATSTNTNNFYFSTLRNAIYEFKHGHLLSFF
ncbi:hypothetical protein imdm_98 [gamma proteobacterium IMCC2047]|nr:hypothetical protein imdm_98 [gamma proteobacterium IMCC2047]